METLEILQITWFILIGILFAGYAVLDGFDLGIGSLLPILTKNDEKKVSVLFRSIGPVWDGNEVWLITAGGALFAAFPHAYATVFSGFYLALMLVLFGLILRAVSIEFFTLETENKGIWAKTFFIGSIIPSILFGVALGNVIMGVPLDASMEFTGNFFTLLRPFPLATGLLGFTAILMQGLTYTMLKTEGEIHDTAKVLAGKVWYGYIVMFLFAAVLSFISVTGSACNIIAWVAAALSLGSLFAAKMLIGKGEEFKAFLASSLAFISLWGIAGALQYPVLVRAINDPALSITAFNASSSQLTLSVMLGIALAGMPVVIGYSIYVYRVYRGKVK
ncbi:MAG TPA: cytochrome d ubiquinol oxidase subunit II [Spirochaetota bacterium]|nr:cytochrome d ubiquinol oxidase subunit II [Spirochaetota bacterium]HPF07669.1 cytochrome d ubiquinol oxidase subunit II [Spirochaetota bacterium]HPJ43989.1 cytochrome d ubiquinol oxidase subunit II [Spirochaetota bacterium]HPR38965.1 cytochrome d ubiquinol oxidase subunit II [Spirochaetota bacterium]HRX48515.1 cytochrome d ubiquinol oxidase subunit II [Spirochaetota bacterium]